MLAQTSTTKEQAVALAQQMIAKQPVYIDTETTGLDRDAEIIEITIVGHDGSVLLEKLVRPAKPIPMDAIRIHHITNEMVQTALPWYSVWQEVRSHLFGHVIAAYNAEFDQRMMQQSLARYGKKLESFQFLDIMKVYADYRGVWDPARRSMKYFKLEEAGQHFNIQIPNAHRATADTLLARAVLHCIAGLPY